MPSRRWIGEVLKAWNRQQRLQLVGCQVFADDMAEHRFERTARTKPHAVAERIEQCLLHDGTLAVRMGGRGPVRNAHICRNDARRLVPQVVQSLTSGACLPIQPFLQHDRDLVSGLLRDRCL
jgi:hypothetical protein